MQFCKAAAKVKEIQSRLFKIRFRVLEIVYWNIYDEILGYIWYKFVLGDLLFDLLANFAALSFWI